MSLYSLRENPRLQRMPTTEQEWVHYANELAKFIADQAEFAVSQAAIVTAQAAADAAQTDATTGVTNAAAAQTTANTGVTNAAAAQTDATTGITNAATAQTTANTGVTNAATAQTQANTGVTNAATAQTALELNNVTVQDLFITKWSDSAGTWPADDSDDLVLTFLRQGSSIATHTIRFVFTQSTGNWTVTDLSETGEATVETITGSGGKDAKAVISHTGSGVIGKITAQALDQSGAGASPSK